MSDMTGNYDNYHHPPLDRVTLGPPTGLRSYDYENHNMNTEVDTCAYNLIRPLYDVQSPY